MWPGIRQSDELAGMFTATVEAALLDLADVTARVDGLPPTPGLDERLHAGEERWSIKLSLVPKPGDVIRFSALVCDPSNTCTNAEADGTRDVPWQAMAQVVTDAASTLGRTAPPDVMATWAVPPSDDPYAILVCGRSAAVYYGIKSPVPESLIGDEKRDPIARAVYIDPAMPLAWWMVGRFRAARGEWGPAREAFTRAAIDRPQSVALRADEASALLHHQRPAQAHAAWAAVQERSPDDPRFAAQRARAALAAKEIPDVLAVLDGLGKRYQNERTVAELRVRVAEATGESSNYDELLERWQEAAPNEAEPVRRRIALREDAGRYDEALGLCAELEARGATNEAGRLAIAFLIGLGRLSEAAERADKIGEVDIAARIRTRAALEATPEALPTYAASLDDAYATIALGEALLARGDAVGAVRAADRVLASNAWQPEALDLRARASGDAATFDALRRAEPSRVRQ